MTGQLCDQCYPEWAEWLGYHGVRAVKIQQTGQSGPLTELLDDNRHVALTTRRSLEIRDTIIRQQDLIVRLCQSTPRPHRWVSGDRSRRIVEVAA